MALKEDPEQSAVPDAVPNSSPDIQSAPGPSSQGSTVSEVVEFYDDLREFALLVSNETNLFDIKEVHMNFKRQSLVQDFDSGMPTLRRFIRPTDWHRVEQMFQIVTTLPPRDLQQRCTFRDPMLFRLPGESRSYLRSKLTSVYLAHEVVPGETYPIHFWMNFSSFDSSRIRRPREQELESVREDEE